MFADDLVARRRETVVYPPPIVRILLVLTAGTALAGWLIAPESAGADGSWIFDHGTYTHDPCSGARVGQYARIPPVEALADQRLVTSRYLCSRLNLRGMDGSLDTYYEVQAWGNDFGGLDAQWERFHDAWKESYMRGPYTTYRPYGPWFYGGFAGPGPAPRVPGYGYGYGPPAAPLPRPSPGVDYGWPSD
jgi:hypothetical protein